MKNNNNKMTANRSQSKLIKIKEVNINSIFITLLYKVYGNKKIPNGK